MTHWLTFALFSAADPVHGVVHRRRSARPHRRRRRRRAVVPLNHCRRRTMHAAAAVSPCLALLLAIVLVPAPSVRGGIISLLQNNVLGSPQFHNQQSWPFDPSVASRRAPEFIALHGDKSEKLIERIGLGMDGRQHQRREQQQIRDFRYDQRQRQLQQEEQQQNFVGGNVYAQQQFQSPRILASSDYAQ